MMICVHGVDVLVNDCAKCSEVGHVVFPETESTRQIPERLRRELPIEALREINEAAKVGALSTASGWFLNYGESNTRMEGWNAGHDAADEDKPCEPEAGAPADEPHRQAWIDGYTEGWQFNRLENLTWHPALPAISNWLAQEDYHVEILRTALAFASYGFPVIWPRGFTDIDALRALLKAIGGEK